MAHAVVSWQCTCFPDPCVCGAVCYMEAQSAYLNGSPHPRRPEAPRGAPGDWVVDMLTCSLQAVLATHTGILYSTDNG